MKSVGTQLREARQGLGWTLKAAAKATKIREDQIQRMEADDFTRFHASTYTRGFVKNYAKALGLNVRQINEQLDKILEVEGDISYQRSGGINYVPELAKTQREFNPRTLTFAVFGLVALVFLGIFGLQVYQVVYRLGSSLQMGDSDLPAAKAESDAKGGTKNKTVEAGSSAPTNPILDTPPNVTVAKALPVDAGPGSPAATTSPAAPAAPTAAVTPPDAPANKLSLAAKEECWVRVSVLENNQAKNIFEGLIQPGASQDFQPANKYLIKAGNPSAIEVSLNGKSYATNHADDHLPAEFSVPSGDTN